MDAVAADALRLDQHDLRAKLARAQGGGVTGGAAADDGKVVRGDG